MYHFYRNKFQFLTDSTDFKKPCERKAKNTFAHVCKICIYAKFAYMQITSMCTGFKTALVVGPKSLNASTLPK